MSNYLIIKGKIEIDPYARRNNERYESVQITETNGVARLELSNDFKQYEGCKVKIKIKL